MSLAADDAGLPADPEFRSAFVAYVEWGTRLALHNSQPGADVAEHAPVPRRGWGVALPLQPKADNTTGPDG
jgi:hemoglobin